MKETVINLFLTEKLKLKEISEKVNLPKEEVDKILRSEHYILHC